MLTEGEHLIHRKRSPFPSRGRLLARVASLINAFPPAGKAIGGKTAVHMQSKKAERIMYLDTKCIVTGTMNVRENDKFVTMITDKYGKLKVNVKGVTGKNKGLLAGVQLFACSKCTIFENRGNYSLDACESIDQFFGISSDIEKLALASYFADLANQCAIYGEECGEIFCLLEAALRNVSAGGSKGEACEQDMRLVKAAFELKLAAVTGYCPELEMCSVCAGTPEMPFFDPFSGLLLCSECRQRTVSKSAMQISKGALDAFRYIISAPYDRIFRFSLGEESIKILSELAEKYVTSKIEGNFDKTLTFCKKCIGMPAAAINTANGGIYA